MSEPDRLQQLAQVLEAFTVLTQQRYDKAQEQMVVARNELHEARLTRSLANAARETSRQVTNDAGGDAEGIRTGLRQLAATGNRGATALLGVLAEHDRWWNSTP